jgi:GT2 family glycosyltransferase
VSSKKLVSVVVVNWNGMQFLPSCLDSVLNQMHANLEVLMVDCASRDQSVSFVRSRYPSAKIIELKQDLGPAHAINLAARRAQGELILILNNDVILPPDMLSRLVNHMNVDTCVLNPVELHSSGAYVGSGCRCTWIGRFLYGPFRLRGNQPFYPSTACCLVSRKLILDNPLNENLFMYEDTEWGWRLHLKGIELKTSRDTYFLHRSSGSEDVPYSPKQAFLIGRAVLATCFICLKAPTLILLSPVLMLNSLSQILRYAKRGKLASIRSYIRGHIDLLVNFKRFSSDRKRVQSERKAGDLRILGIMIGSVDFARKARQEWEYGRHAEAKLQGKPCPELVCD